MAEGKGRKQGFLEMADRGRRRIAKAGFKGEASRANSEIKGERGYQRRAAKSALKDSMKVDKVGKKPVRRTTKRTGMR